MLLHSDKIFQENLFPVGAREDLLLWVGLGLTVITAVFFLLAGIATFKRKWPVRGWITSVLLGLFLLGSVAGGALATDAAPRVEQRYHAIEHTTAVGNIQPFNKVVSNGEIDLEYIQSADYAVNVHYVDNPDISKIHITVHDNTLYVDSHELDTIKHCTMLCLFPRYNMTIQIYAPNVSDFQTPPHTDIFYPNVPALPRPVRG